MTEIYALVAWALGLWGWGGLVVNVNLVTMEWGAVALTTPYPGKGLAIELDAFSWEHSTQAERERRILHEVGHGVGYFYRDYTAVDPWRDHSLDPASVMYPAFESGQAIQPEDRLIVMQNTRWWMPHKAIIQAVSR